MSINELQMLDINEPDLGVEVVVSSNGTRLWINIDGICRLRVCGMKPDSLVIENYHEAATQKETAK